MFSSQLCQFELQPWMKTSGVPPPADRPRVEHVDAPPAQLHGRCSGGQSTSIQVASSPSAYVASAPGRSSAVAHRRGELCAW